VLKDLAKKYKLPQEPEPTEKNKKLYLDFIRKSMYRDTPECFSSKIGSTMDVIRDPSSFDYDIEILEKEGNKYIKEWSDSLEKVFGKL